MDAGDLKEKRSYERFRYSEQALATAMTTVRNGEMSLNKASKQYNIPKGTLYNKLKGKVPDIRKMGPPPVLLPAEELRLETWILNKAKVGFPMHSDKVKAAVQAIMKVTERENPFTDDRPGDKWLKLFLKRRPGISKHNTEMISKARAAVTEEGIKTWFDEVKAYITEEGCLDIFDDASRIFNADETGMVTCPKTGKVLGPKVYRNFYEVASGTEKECITVLCNVSASGTAVPPMIVFPYKRIPRDIAQSIPDDYAIGRSETGWMVSATFFEYIANFFYPWLLEHQVKFPVLLYLDGHKSHINEELYEFCVAKRILIVCLLPNATHILQPCDVAIFRALKVEWKRAIRNFKQKTSKSVTKVNFTPLFSEAFDASMKKETIINGFRACGLFPFNVGEVDVSKCISKRRQELFEDTLPDTADLPEPLNYGAALKVIETELDPDTRKRFDGARETGNEDTVAPLLYRIWSKCKDIDSIGNNQNEPSTTKTKTVSNVHSDQDLLTDEEYDGAPVVTNNAITAGVVMNPTEIADLTHNNPQKSNLQEAGPDEMLPTQQDASQIDQQSRPSSKPSEETVGPIAIAGGSKTPSTPASVLTKFRSVTPEAVWNEHLHCPRKDETGKSNRSATRKKQTSPFAVTSKQWKNFHDLKEEEKRAKEENRRLKQEQIKEKRKIVAEQKEAAKRRKLEEKAAKAAQTKSKRKKKTKPLLDEETSTDSDMSVLSETETDYSDTTSSNESANERDPTPVHLKLKVNDYVIVEYEQEYFPGIIQQIVGKKYEVSTMTISGITSWKWTNAGDEVCWYEEEAVKEKIAVPTLLGSGSRAVYSVPEISKYRKF